ncbi:WXG100 family type VII secretion target [Streptomyces sp. NBC_00536]|uniref:WXG100 family type VII secretion target n=1 Tax=Streptomyces sp. NBC_00536 TaxID=2975769 RepID=UPI002E809D2F|nr:WXG100 family type VII secretion target [Streptomyces sp. NBC_00536]WUC79653.1 WXG100 family type VII secretion target [Streptomyces sp. NBC_00536]
MQNSDLDVSQDDLGRLADDLDAMQAYLDEQTRRMDRVVDAVAAGWQGPTATAYRSLHQGVAEDAVRIRQVLVLLEAATRASRDGFTEQEMETLSRLKKMQDGEDVPAAARALQAPDPAPPAAPARPHSRILDM